MNRPGVSSRAAIPLIVWSAIEAAFFTFAVGPTVSGVVSDLTGFEFNAIVLAVLLGVFLTVIVAGSYACIQVQNDAIKAKQIGNVVNMLLVQLSVGMFEVLFLRRVLIDELTPWLAQAGLTLGDAGEWGLVILAWVGVRGMAWYLIGRSGAPALLAALSREPVAIEGGVGPVNRALVMALALLGSATIGGCKPPENAPPPRSTLVIGLDVSGSFRQTQHFDQSIEFAALYIYGHLHGLGGLREPTDVFIGSLGGQQANQPKAFHPIQDLSGKSVEEIQSDLRAWFPETDPLTDFNTFFNRVAVHVRRQNLVLSPLSIVMFSDGEPDFPGSGRISAEERYRRIDLSPLEYLSRSVTVRLLYATPRVAQLWEQQVPRKRVKVWTQDWQTMAGWPRHVVAGAPPERQDSLWSWMSEIVDFRVRRGRIL